MTSPAGESPPRNNSSSLRRALAILLQLGEDLPHRRGASLTELSADLHMNKSTLLRLLAPLLDARLVRQDPDSGRYQLGWRTAQLGQTYLERLDLRDIAHPVLQRLAVDVGETAHLVIPDFPEVVYVDKVDSPQPVRMVSRIGSRQWAYCTGVGKAMLAHAPDDVLQRVIERGMPRRTPNTHTTAASLTADLATIRTRGYAVDDIENEADIRCVAAAVLDHAGAASCAISASGPAGRLTSKRVPRIGRSVVEAAAEISRRLGAPR